MMSGRWLFYSILVALGAAGATLGNAWGVGLPELDNDDAPSLRDASARDGSRRMHFSSSILDGK